MIQRGLDESKGYVLVFVDAADGEIGKATNVEDDVGNVKIDVA